MRRTRTADRRGTRRRRRNASAARRAPAGIVVRVAGRCPPLRHEEVRAAALQVVRRERRRADLSIAFVDADRMRDLNRRWKGRREPTDVLAFALGGAGGSLLGDIYVCPAVAAREARARSIGVREELLRLVVHGTLHVLGWDHPEGENRTASPMWRRQERLLKDMA